MGRGNESICDAEGYPAGAQREIAALTFPGSGVRREAKRHAAFCTGPGCGGVKGGVAVALCHRTPHDAAEAFRAATRLAGAKGRSQPPCEQNKTSAAGNMTRIN